MLASTSDNASRSFRTCISVFLTPFTRPVWIPLPCDSRFTMNYFLCETGKSTKTRTNHSMTTIIKRNNTTCPDTYTFVSKQCFKLKRYNSIVQPYHFRFHLLTNMLSRWGLSSISLRHTVYLYSNETHSTYLQTNDFSFQRLALWSMYDVTSKISSKFQLNEVDYVIYDIACIAGQHFTCDDRTCILSTYICDDVTDCLDKSDENITMCAELYDSYNLTNCSDIHFSCISGECVMASHMCDDEFDCRDGSDEINCAVAYKHYKDIPPVTASTAKQVGYNQKVNAN